ncbi:MAG: hypothetical protein IJB92_07405 [Clostridia bacterium]|nr:hypothetical protein [Clostridia bacterium]
MKRYFLAVLCFLLLILLAGCFQVAPMDMGGVYTYAIEPISTATPDPVYEIVVIEVTPEPTKEPVKTQTPKPTKTKTPEKTAQPTVKPTEEPDDDHGSTVSKTGFSGRLYYDQLSSGEKDLFALLYDLIDDCETKISFKNSVSKDSLERVIFALYTDCPEFIHFSKSYAYRSDPSNNSQIVGVNLSYTMSKSQYDSASKQLESVLESVASAVSGKSEYEKELYCYDYVKNRCTYTTSGDQVNTAYGVLVNGRGLCEGYSKAFVLALRYCGVQSAYIGGEAMPVNGNVSGSHGWTIVRIGGKYYQCDATWDDNADANTVCPYAYFNITDKEMYATRTIGQEYKRFSIPSCTSTKYNYYRRLGNIVHSDSISSDVSGILDKYYSKQPLAIAIKAEDAATYKDLVSDLNHYLNDYRRDHSGTYSKLSMYKLDAVNIIVLAKITY